VWPQRDAISNNRGMTEGNVENLNVDWRESNQAPCEYNRRFAATQAGSGTYYIPLSHLGHVSYSARTVSLNNVHVKERKVIPVTGRRGP
jgi:hypothetical protein